MDGPSRIRRRRARFIPTPLCWKTNDMTKLNWITLACAAALSGCSLMPAYERPALPVPSAYPTVVSATGAASAEAADIDWRDFFADERLGQVLALALANNRD